ncbi:MAG: SUMF1/EgtB/PvdO family nonheme iron enzyme [Thermoguttaceae bacterium]
MTSIRIKPFVLLLVLLAAFPFFPASAAGQDNGSGLPVGPDWYRWGDDPRPLVEADAPSSEAEDGETPQDPQEDSDTPKKGGETTQDPQESGKTPQEGGEAPQESGEAPPEPTTQAAKKPTLEPDESDDSNTPVSDSLLFLLKAVGAGFCGKYGLSVQACCFACPAFAFLVLYIRSLRKDRNFEGQLDGAQTREQRKIEKKRQKKRWKRTLKDLKRKPGKKMKLYIGGHKYVFRWCPACDRRAGDKRAASQRDLEDRRANATPGFWLLETVVTQQMWRDVTGRDFSPYPARPQSYARQFVAKGKAPVYYVTWDGCMEFVKSLNDLKDAELYKQNAVFKDMEFRLPWEGEWEYACLTNAAAGSFGLPYRRGPNDAGNAPVTKFRKSNAWKLRNMLGNVWEWVNDVGDEYSLGFREATNSQFYLYSTAYSATNRLARGGSWREESVGIDPLIRREQTNTDSCDDLGFRVALSWKEDPPYSRTN